MTGKQLTNFKFLARHEDLRIGNDGGRLAELEPVGCVEGRGRVKKEEEVCFSNNGSTFKRSIPSILL